MTLVVVQRSLASAAPRRGGRARRNRGNKAPPSCIYSFRHCCRAVIHSAILRKYVANNGVTTFAGWAKVTSGQPVPSIKGDHRA